jgi:hypothetical protein
VRVVSEDDVGAGAEPESTILSVPKLFRLLDMVSELHDVQRGAPLDDASRMRVRAIIQATVFEAKDALSSDLLAELSRLAAPLGGSATSDELRIATTELLGWLEGIVVDLSLAVEHPARGGAAGTA